jgi:hypothetical protein
MEGQFWRKFTKTHKVQVTVLWAAGGSSAAPVVATCRRARGSAGVTSMSCDLEFFGDLQLGQRAHRRATGSAIGSTFCDSLLY